MQTFLPYPDYTASARCLDRARLGKQRVEAYQILRTLLGRTQGWRNHPAVRMWRGHEISLVRYATCMCREWVHRGYADSVQRKLNWYSHYLVRSSRFSDAPPVWMGTQTFHASHRSNLLRKNLEWYGQFLWADPPDLPYFWPV